MGILTKQLIAGNKYWVFNLPVIGSQVLGNPLLLKCIDIKYLPELAEKGRNYNRTYIFENGIEIPGYFDFDTKSYLENIDNYIIGYDYKHIINIIRNHLKKEFQETIKQKKIDRLRLIYFIEYIEKNNPELLI